MKWIDVDRIRNEYQDELRRYVARKARNKSEVEDIVQEVFLRLRRVKEAREPLALLWVIARRLIIDRHRRKEQQDRFSRIEGATPGERATEDPFEAGSALHRQIDFEAALQKAALAHPRNFAVFQAFREGRTAREIGEMLGLKGNSIYRARDRFIALISKFLGTSSGRRNK